MMGIIEGILQDNDASVNLIHPSRGQVDSTDSSKPEEYFSSDTDITRLIIHKIEAKRRFEQGFSPKMMIEAIKTLRGRKNRIVWCEFTWTGVMGILIALITKSPLILDEHNIEHIRLRRFGLWMYPIVKILEYMLWVLSKKILVVSEQDKEFMKHSIFKRKTLVVTNGYSSDLFAPNQETGKQVRSNLGLKTEEKMLLFFGKLDYSPNKESLQIISNHIAPALQNEPFKIIIAGSSLDEKCTLPENCQYVGMVPKIADYINAADVVLVPLQSGGGTRLKIIESIACGVPVVSTRIGAEGLPIDEVKGLLKVIDDDNWQEFIDCTRRMALYPPSQETKEVVLARIESYSWKAIGKGIQRILTSLQEG